MKQFESQLKERYPLFLKKIDKKDLDEKIAFFCGKKAFLKNDLRTLNRLLWIKKDFYRKDYLSEKERKILAIKTARAKISDIWSKYAQVNILKYMLGLNDAAKLSNYLKRRIVLDKKTKEIVKKFNNNSNWQLWPAGVYFDILHFYNLKPSKEDIVKLGEILKKSPDSRQKVHLLEHGINKVPVHVNGCRRAKNSNERYHCLFFKKL